MLYFSSNLKFLRKRIGKTQDEVAIAVGTKRSTLSGWENGISEPSLEKLLAISKYFKIAADTLMSVRLEKLSELQIRELEAGNDIFINGSQLRILASTVSQVNEENIEVVNEKAKAGYKTGFADPEYIKILPSFQLPFLSKDRKYRSFQVSGDSMLPVPDGSYVTGEFLQNWFFIKDHTPCIILTKEEGIVFKIVENQLKTKQRLILYSLNSLYKPYAINADEIREIWKFVHYISSEMPRAFVPNDQIIDTIKNLQHEVESLKENLSK